MFNDARLAIARLNLSECLVTAQSADLFVQNLTAYSRMDRAQGEQALKDTIANVEQTYGFAASRDDDVARKPFIFQDGMAVIPVHGVLLNRFSSCWGFATGYNFIRAQMNAALADDDVDLIVYDVNSPGGDAAGCFELTEEIRASRAVKPSIAIIDDLAASGGFAIAAAPTRTIATNSSSVGSIGVYRMTVDVREADAKEGIKFDFITSEGDDFKLAGSPHVEMTDEIRQWFQDAVNTRKDDFVADIIASRGMSDEDIRATKAKVYRAQDALALGMIDGVSTPTEAVSAFVAELADDEPSEDEDDNMAIPKTEAEFAAAIAEAEGRGKSSVSLPDVAAERASAVAADRALRVSIMGCDEAKDKQKLASTCADQGMTLETAKVVLNAAASEKVETAAPPKKNALESVMDKTGGAGVKAEGGESEEQVDADAEPRDKTAGILKFVPKARRADGNK